MATVTGDDMTMGANGDDGRDDDRNNLDDRPTAPRPVVDYRDGWEARIPDEIASRRQWVIWSYEWRKGKPAIGAKPATPGKWTKVLYQPDAPVSRARANDPKTWGSLGLALKAFRREREIFDGIGFVFSENDPFCGIDFDACLDGSGNPHKWATDLLELTSSTYREISPSGHGIKAIVSANLGDRKGTNARGIGGKDQPGSAIEIYDRGRFFAITGSTWGDSPRAILAGDAAQSAADAIYTHIQAVRSERDEAKKAKAREKKGDRKTGSRSGAQNGYLLLGRPPADDAQLLYLARTASNGPEFSALYDRGDLSSHASDSEADGALCCHLAFWTQKDPARMESLWLASALGQRGKVIDRPDYRAVTIATAIEKTDSVYRPTPRPPIPVIPEMNGQAAKTLNATDEIPWTDRGLAERVVKLYGHSMRYCQPWKKWLVWDGARWKIDDTLQVDRFIKATIRRMQVEELATIADPESKESFRAWAISCESKKTHESALRLIQGEDGIPIVPKQLDMNPWLFNCPNGTVDLTTGELRPHDRLDLITKLCPVEFNPSASCPLWDEVMARFLPNDDLRRWVDLLFGYCLTGTIREQILAIFYGLGANGKSTILNTLYRIMGSDYALKAPPDLLMQKKGNGHPTEQASLFGKRLVIAIETEEGERFNESLVKELTGDDPITARRMRENFWSFEPTHKIILATNHKPSVKGSDNGIWRRLKLVEFGVSLTLDQQDTSIPDRLKPEAPGILARAVKSCLTWQQSGMVDPPVIRDATVEYREAEDVFGQFISEICDVSDVQAESASGVIYTAYKFWAESNGFHIASMKRFSRALEDKGHNKRKSGHMLFEGIKLRDPGIPYTTE